MFKKPDLYFHMLFICLGIPAFLIHAIFNNELFWGLAIFWTLIICLFGLSKFLRKEISSEVFLFFYSPSYVIAATYGFINGLFWLF